MRLTYDRLTLIMSHSVGKYMLGFFVTEKKKSKQKKKKPYNHHLGPESSMACASREESSVRSEYRSEENSLTLYLFASVL